MSPWVAMLVSIAVEAPLVVALGWRQVAPERRWALLGIALLATLLTQPAAWRAMLWLAPRWSPWPAWLLLEAAVVVAEGLLYAWFVGLRRGLGISALANASSALLGLAWRRWG